MGSNGAFPRRRAVCRFEFASVLLCSITIVFFFTPRSDAQSRDLVVTSVSPGSRATLSGHHPPWASDQNDIGAVPADLAIDQLALVLARSPQQEQAFEQFFAAQQDPSSPDYHHWLTPVELGARFGATQHDIDAITNWLQGQNLHVDSVSNSRMRIRFSGAGSDIANAFGAEMHYFLMGGEQRMSMAAEPQVPAALAGIIKSIHGLSTLKITPSHGMGTAQVPALPSNSGSEGGVVPAFTSSGGNHYLFPADFAKIYDVNVGNITGAGQTIAVIGTSRVYPTDITNFQSLAGLTPQAPTVIIPPTGTDPGPPQTSPPMSGSSSPSQGEATLDVTRAASIAPGATIDLVVSGNGIEIPIEYVAEGMTSAQIMTISFGACEAQGSQAEANFFDSLYSQAAAGGISVFVSSGDGGAAECDAFFTKPPSSQQILSPSILCASSFATCTGGTEFADSVASQYWTSNGVNFESALGYIPEGAWNEPGTNNSPMVAATGGGVSAFIGTPSWQTGPGVPGNQGRYTPDIAFSSAAHDGYFVCFAAAGSTCSASSIGNSLIYFLGTSAAAPDMAGITALLDQKIGSAQGNLNPRLYQLAATPGKNVFHDVTVASSGVSNCTLTVPSMCNNSTPSPAALTGGLSGYQVGVGYDEATGLGSIDVANLLANWALASNSTVTTVTSSLNPSTIGATVTFTAAVTSTLSGTPTGTVTFLNNGTSIGTGTLNSSSVATLSTSSLAVGSISISAQYGGDTNFVSSLSTALSQVVNLEPTTTALTSSLDPSVGGQSLTFTATVTSTSSGTPTGIVTFQDNGITIGTGGVTASGVATLVISTLAVAAAAHPIAAHYLGDSTFAASTSAAVNQTVNIAGFAPPPSPLTVTAGQNLPISLTIYAATGSNLSLTLSCTGLPAKTTCMFGSNPLTPAAPPNGTTVTLTFGTASSRLPTRPSNRGPLP